MRNLEINPSPNQDQSPKFLIGIYVRNSDEKQDKEEGTIKNQRLRLLDWVENRNNNKFDHFQGEVVKVYEERSLSAKDMNRPVLKKLLRDVQKGKINMILVNELSRISRNTKDFNEIWDFLKTNKCKFVSLREDFDTSSAAGEMMLLMLANFAQFERRQTQERVTLSHLSRAKRGLFCGGTIPMGYQKVKDRPGYLEIVPEQAAIVRKAFKAFLEREGLSEAAKLLNGDGDDSKATKIVRTVQGGGSWSRLEYWNVSNLHHILRNVSYKGIKSYQENGKVKYAKAVWEPIIDEVTFDRVQEILDKNYQKKKPLREGRVWPYLLTGLTFCQTCGEAMCGKSAHGRSKKYPYYEHSWASKRGSSHLKDLYKCDPHRVSAKLVEDAVLKEIEKLLSDEDLANLFIEKAKSLYQKRNERNDVKELKRKIAGFKSLYEGLVDRISNLPPDIDADPFYNKMRGLKKDQEKVEQDLKEALISGNKEEALPTSLTDYRAYLELIKLVFSEVSTLGHEQKTKLINRLIHRIEIGPKDLKIYFFVGSKKISMGIRSLKQEEENLKFEEKNNEDFFESQSSRGGSRTLTNGAEGGT